MKEEREQTPKEQNHEHKEANSGDLSRSESYNPEAKDACDQCNHQENQRVVKYVTTSIGRV